MKLYFLLFKIVLGVILLYICVQNVMETGRSGSRSNVRRDSGLRCAANLPFDVSFIVVYNECVSCYYECYLILFVI